MTTDAGGHEVTGWDATTGPDTDAADPAAADTRAAEQIAARTGASAADRAGVTADRPIPPVAAINAVVTSAGAMPDTAADSRADATAIPVPAAVVAVPIVVAMPVAARAAAITVMVPHVMVGTGRGRAPIVVATVPDPGSTAAAHLVMATAAVGRVAVAPIAGGRAVTATAVVAPIVVAPIVVAMQAAHLVMATAAVDTRAAAIVVATGRDRATAVVAPIVVAPIVVAMGVVRRRAAARHEVAATTVADSTAALPELAVATEVGTEAVAISAVTARVGMTRAGAIRADTRAAIRGAAAIKGETAGLARIGPMMIVSETVVRETTGRETTGRSRTGSGGIGPPATGADTVVRAPARTARTGIVRRASGLAGTTGSGRTGTARIDMVTADLGRTDLGRTDLGRTGLVASEGAGTARARGATGSRVDGPTAPVGSAGTTETPGPVVVIKAPGLVVVTASGPARAIRVATGDRAATAIRLAVHRAIRARRVVMIRRGAGSTSGWIVSPRPVLDWIARSMIRVPPIALSALMASAVPRTPTKSTMAAPATMAGRNTNAMRSMAPVTLSRLAPSTPGEPDRSRERANVGTAGMAVSPSYRTACTPTN